MKRISTSEMVEESVEQNPRHADHGGVPLVTCRSRSVSARFQCFLTFACARLTSSSE
jgi:hypothetical protein